MIYESLLLMFEGPIQNPNPKPPPAEAKEAPPEGLGRDRGDSGKVKLILTPSRPPSLPLQGREGVNPHHSLASTKIT